MFLRNTTWCLVLVAIVALVALPHFSFAQVGEGYSRGENAADQAGLTKNTDIKEIITNVLYSILGFLGVIAVFALIVAGITYMTSLGDEKKAEAAKQTIFYVVIGLILILLSGAIVNLVLKNFK